MSSLVQTGYVVYGNAESGRLSGVKLGKKNSYRKKDAEVTQRLDGTREEKQPT